MKTVVEEHICLSMITDHDEYVPTIINKDTSFNKTTIKLKLFKTKYHQNYLS